MQVILAIISLVFLGAIVYFLISPKSSHLLRMSAIIALVLIGLALGVCGVFLLRGPSKVETEIPLPFLTDAKPKQETKTSIGVIIGYFAAFAIIFGLVAYSSKKEKGRKAEPVKKAPKKENFQSANENEMDPEQKQSDDESFDIDLG